MRDRARLVWLFAFWGGGVLLAQEPRLVIDLNPGPAFGLFDTGGCTGPGIPRPGFTTLAVEDMLYFSADDGVTGAELWRTDGTEAGTEQVIDLAPGPAGGLRTNCNAVDWVFVDGGLYFVGGDGMSALGLWRSDGSAGGTARLGDVVDNPFFGSLPPVRVGNTVLFIAEPDDTGQEPWRTLGGPATILADIEPGEEGSDAIFMLSAGGMHYFQARRAVDGNELWRTDGSTAGTEQVADLNPGSGGSLFRGFVPFGDGVVFATDVPADALYRIAGPSSAPVELRGFDLPPFTSSFVRPLGPVENGAVGNGVVFVVVENDLGQLWFTDGTPEGTSEIPGASLDFAFGFFGTPVTVGGVVFFQRIGMDSQRELWRSDGTAAGTFRLMSFILDSGGRWLRWFLPTPDELLFAATVEGSEAPSLWRTDGTVAGTVPIAPLCPGTDDCLPFRPSLIVDTLVYAADDGVHGRELWALDLTPGSALPIPTASGVGLLALALLLAASALVRLRH